MNKWHKLIGVITIFIIGVSFVYLVSQNRIYKNDNSINSDIISTGALIPALSIEVYDSSGNLKYSYTKVGDPPTKNLLLWILHTFWQNRANKEFLVPSWTAETGTSGTPADGYYCHGGRDTTVSGVSYMTMKIAIGTGTTPPTINDYKLEYKTAEFGVSRYLFAYNDTHMWIYIRGVYTATASISFQEVGLFGYFYYAINYNDYWIMLFRDVLPNPISLNQGDSMIIGYYIYVRYA